MEDVFSNAQTVCCDDNKFSKPTFSFAVDGSDEFLLDGVVNVGCTPVNIAA